MIIMKENIDNGEKAKKMKAKEIMSEGEIMKSA